MDARVRASITGRPLPFPEAMTNVAESPKSIFLEERLLVWTL